MRVALADRPLDRQRIQSVGRQPRGIEVDPQLTRTPADQRHFGYVGDFGDSVTQLRGQGPQLIVAVSLGPQGHGQNRHIVDRPAFDDWADHSRRNAIGMGREFLVEPHERGLFGLADQEAHDHHRLSGG